MHKFYLDVAFNVQNCNIYVHKWRNDIQSIPDHCNQLAYKREPIMDRIYIYITSIILNGRIEWNCLFSVRWKLQNWFSLPPWMLIDNTELFIFAIFHFSNNYLHTRILFSHVSAEKHLKLCILLASTWSEMRNEAEICLFHDSNLMQAMLCT